MKKLICLLLCCAMVLSLAACGGSGGTETTETTAPTETTQPEPTAQELYETAAQTSAQRRASSWR